MWSGDKGGRGKEKGGRERNKKKEGKGRKEGERERERASGLADWLGATGDSQIYCFPDTCSKL